MREVLCAPSAFTGMCDSQCDSQPALDGRFLSTNLG